jgi:hypothetical protein
MWYIFNQKMWYIFNKKCGLFLIKKCATFLIKKWYIFSEYTAALYESKFAIFISNFVRQKIFQKS